MSYNFDNPEIVRAIIIDHYEKPENFLKNQKKIDKKYCSYNLSSSNCIDNITAFIFIRNKIIKDLKFSGIGCAICTSSTDIMSSLLKNKSLNQSKKIIKNYLSMIDGKQYDNKLLSNLLVYKNVNKQINRINCAKIGIQTILKAIEKYEKSK